MEDEEIQSIITMMNTYTYADIVIKKTTTVKEKTVCFFFNAHMQPFCITIQELHISTIQIQAKKNSKGSLPLHRHRRKTNKQTNRLTLGNLI